MFRSCFLALVVLPAAIATAQFHEPLITTRPGETVVQRWQVGVKVSLPAGGMKNLVATMPVPADWPEQKVRVLGEDLSPGAKVSYQTIDDGAKQMTITFPKIGAGEELRGLVTFEITRKLQEKPADTSQYQLPDVKKSDRKLSAYLAPSPYIESTHGEIRALARQVGADEKKAWARVEAIYRWVRGRVQYKEEPLKGALAALHDGTGDCDELSSLFIAICRAAGIPARTVRLPTHCYAEFYLVDEKGVGQWFPCQPAGTEAFGEMPDPRPILQKGDNILCQAPLGKKKERCRFLPQNFTAVPLAKGEQPKVEFICQLLP